MAEGVRLSSPDDPSHRIEALRGRTCIRSLGVTDLGGDPGERALGRREISHRSHELPLTIRQTRKDALHVRSRLRPRRSPATHDMLACDRLTATGVPGPFSSELEQERLAATDINDRPHGILILRTRPTPPLPSGTSQPSRTNG